MSTAFGDGDTKRVGLNLCDSGLGSFGSESDTSPNAHTPLQHHQLTTSGNLTPAAPENWSMNFTATYFGEAVLDRRHTSAMLPWIVADVRRRCGGGGRRVVIVVSPGSLRAVGVSSPQYPIFEHPLCTVTRFTRMPHDAVCFSYLTRPNSDSPFTCHVFQASDETAVEKLFETVRRATVSVAKEPVSPSNDVLSCMSASQLYEVLYIGKVVVSTKKAPPTFIDDAVSKFEDFAKQQAFTGAGHDISSSCTKTRARLSSNASVHSLPADLEHVVTICENDLASKHKLPVGEGASGDGTTSSGSDDAFIVGKPSSADRTVENSDSETNSSSHESLYESVAKPSSSQSQKGSPAPIPPRPLCLQRLAVHQRVRAVSECTDQRNRTMLIQVGHDELVLISLDRKSVIFERQFKDISFCSQGITHPEHFGFISRDPESGNFTCYVFRCASESVVEEIMLTLKQAFQSAFEQSGSLSFSRNLVVCELCPMHQLHKLCLQIDKMPVDEVHETLQQRVHQLSEDDQLTVRTKLLQTAGHLSVHDVNELMMSSLLKLSAVKQHDHVHLGDAGRSTHGKYDFILSHSPKAKLGKSDGFSWRSFGSSIEQLLKGRSPNGENAPRHDSCDVVDSPESMQNSSSIVKSIIPAPHVERKPTAQDHRSSLLADTNVTAKQRRHSTPYRVPQLFGSAMLLENAAADDARNCGSVTSLGSSGSLSPSIIPQDSPIRSMFAKVGNGTMAVVGRCPPGSARYRGGATGRSASSRLPPGQAAPQWNLGGSAVRRGHHHHATASLADTGASISRGLASLRKTSPVPARKMKALWQKAILETVLLIRMNKENKTLDVARAANSRPPTPASAASTVSPHDGSYRPPQQPPSQRRPQSVLDYDEITPCLKDVTKVWEQMISTPDRASTLFDIAVLTNAVKDGVPRSLRGEIWELLVEQHRLHHSQSSSAAEADAAESSGLEQYQELLKQLTLHQHAILIDLGRTFPGHPYFSTQLGPGQLSLFNLLKAYSLLDEEVGYCQGLSFIAGVLLLHIAEQKAFEIMKYMMFELGFRRQYRPDMVSLQIQMYQLSRLLHDYHKDLYDHFEINEIAPTLYAAPWFLTLFASQFPLGFVARVFDLIFLHGMEVVLKVSLALLGNLKELIKQCIGFESIVEFLKSTLPEMGIIQLERVINQVFAMDISKQLEAYEVEYHILQEEMSASLTASGPRGTIGGSVGGTPDVDSTGEQMLRLQVANDALRRQKTELLEQLQAARRQNHSLEEQNQVLLGSERKLRSHIRALELERTALLGAVSALRRMVPDPAGLAELSSTNPFIQPPQLGESASSRLRSPLEDLDREVAALMAARCCDESVEEADDGPRDAASAKSWYSVKGLRLFQQLRADRPASANC